LPLTAGPLMPAEKGGLYAELIRNFKVSVPARQHNYKAMFYPKAAAGSMGCEGNTFNQGK
jgi:hypothetical protein